MRQRALLFMLALAALPAGAQDDPARRALMRQEEGLRCSGSARYGAAISHLEAAVRLWQLAEAPIRCAKARAHLAGVLSEIGRVPEALDVLADARRVLTLDAHRRAHGEAEVMRGLVLMDAGRSAGAARALTSGRRILILEEDAAGVARAEQLLGSTILSLGRHEEAVRLFQSSTKTRRRLGLAFGEALSLTGLGDAYRLGGHAPRAARAYAEAVRVGAPLGIPEATWRARLGAGLVAESQRDPDAALSHYRKAISDVESIRFALGTPALRLRYLENKLRLYRRSAFLLATRGEIGEAFALTEAAHARTLLELAAYSPARPDASSGERAAQEAESRLFALRWRRASLPAAAAGTDLDAEIRSAADAHRTALARLDRRRPRRTLLAGLARPPTLTEVRAALPQETVLLEYLIGENRSAVWVVTPDQARFVPLPEARRDPVAALVRRIHAPVDRLRRGTTDVANLEFDARAAAELHRLLIAPVLPHLAGARVTFVVPDGPLHRLPFSMLVSRWQPREIDHGRLYAHYAGCRFLIQDIEALATLPTAGLLCRRPPSRGPVRASPSVRVLAPPRPRHGLALGEVKRLARVLGPRLRDPIPATRSAFAALDGVSDIVHVATHAIADDARPGRSRLLLAVEDNEPAWLQAAEIEQRRLATDLVVLSACDTAGTARDGEGVTGLTRAFLAAGASQVMASSWAVDDVATTKLMVQFYESVARGQAAPRALADAQRAVLEQERSPGMLMTHPYFWAGFRLFGAGPP